MLTKTAAPFSEIQDHKNCQYQSGSDWPASGRNSLLVPGKRRLGIRRLNLFYNEKSSAEVFFFVVLFEFHLEFEELWIFYALR